MRKLTKKTAILGALSGAILSAGPGSAWAVNRAIVFGGNCDGPVSANTFLYNMATDSAALSKNGWQVENLYSGASARCSLLHSDAKCSGGAPSADCCPEGVDPQGWNVSIYSEIAGVPVDQIQVASKDNLIKALSDAQSLGPSDQLLIIFETHGSQAAPQQALSHGVCADQFVIIGDDKNDPVTGEDPFYVALDQVQAKGVKMAIIDDSCYSGGSLSNYGSYGCVLSAGTSNRPTTELPGSTALAELLTGQDTKQDGTSTPIVSLASLELNHFDSGSGHRLTMEELFLKSLFTGNSLLLSERLREINGFTPGDAFAETIGARMIPSDPNGDELDLYPDFNMNNSAAWSDPVAMSGISQQIQQLFGLLQGSVIQPPASADLSQEQKTIAAYTQDLKNEGYDFASPAFEAALVQSQIPADIRKQLADYQGFASQYASQAQSIKGLAAQIAGSTFPIQFQFSGPLAGSEDAFWQAYTSSSGSTAHLTDPGTGKIANVTLWSNLMGVVDQSPDNLASRMASEADIVTSAMRNNGFQGVTPDFKTALAQMMASSIQRGWSSLSSDQQAALSQLYSAYLGAQIAQSNAYGNFEYHDNFRTGVNLRIGQNQAYNYLNYRSLLLGNGGTLSSAQQADLAQLKSCSAFTLRNLQ